MRGLRGLNRALWAVGLLATAIVLVLTAIGPVWFLQAREAVFDTYQRLHPRIRDPQAQVHVIDIDEPSLAEFGQWPWPRTYLAELNDRLFALGAAAVAYDILFAEPDRTSPSAIAGSWERFSPGEGGAEQAAGDLVRLLGLPDHDDILARELAERPVVLGVAGSGTDGPAGLAPKAGISQSGTAPVAGIASFPGLLPPRPGLAEAAAGLGTLSLGRGDGAGITRAVPMVAQVAGVLWPSLSAELLRVAQGASGHVLRTAEGTAPGSGGQSHAVAMQSGELAYPLDREGRFRVHFAGNLKERLTSAADILRGPGPDPELAAQIAGKLILVGASAQALFDVHATPLEPVVPGVVVQAEILEQILAGTFLTRPDWMLGLELVAAALTGLLLTALAVRVHPVTGIVVWGALVGGLAATGWAAFAFLGLLFDPLPALGTAVFTYIPLSTGAVFARERARARIRNSFAHFLPAPVIDRIAADPSGTLTPLGDERDITVIFIDMRGFTAMTEKMEPRDVVEMLNRYLAAVADTLVEHGATIDKFIGDAVMAFWNAPLRQKDHHALALRALAALRPALDAANRDLEAMGLPRVGIRAGINAGPAFVGLLGSDRRLNYSAIGDCVTVAARLEAMTRRYGVNNLVGATALGTVPSELVAVHLDEVTVRGRVAPLEIATVLERARPGVPAFATACAAFWDAMHGAEWTAAGSALRDLRATRVEGVDLGTLGAFYDELLTRRRLGLSGSQLPEET